MGHDRRSGPALACASCSVWSADGLALARASCSDRDVWTTEVEDVSGLGAAPPCRSCMARCRGRGRCSGHRAEALQRGDPRHAAVHPIGQRVAGPVRRGIGGRVVRKGGRTSDGCARLGTGRAPDVHGFPDRVACPLDGAIRGGTEPLHRAIIPIKSMGRPRMVVAASRAVVRPSCFCHQLPREGAMAYNREAHADQTARRTPNSRVDARSDAKHDGPEEFRVAKTIHSACSLTEAPLGRPMPWA